MHREQRYNNMQHINNTEQNTENSTEQDNTQNNAQPQHRCITYDLHTYSFDFIVEDYISKNSIIQLYTKLIHFGHLIDEVSKITIILIH